MKILQNFVAFSEYYMNFIPIRQVVFFTFDFMKVTLVQRLFLRKKIEIRRSARSYEIFHYDLIQLQLDDYLLISVFSPEFT